MVLLSTSAFAASLLNVASIMAAANNGAVITLVFAAQPRFLISGQGTTDLTLTLVDTQVSQIPLLRPEGVVTSVEVVRSGPNVVMHLHLSIPAAFNVNPVGNRLVVAISGVAAQPNDVSPPGLNSETSAANALGAPVEVISLKYADVSEIVGVLITGQTIAPNDTFAPQPSSLGNPNIGGGGFGGSFGGVSNGGTFNSQQAATGFTQFGTQAQSVGQRINDNIAIDRRLNAIILSGTATQIAAFRATIAQLDVPLQSVLLETQIVELTDTAARNVGIDFRNNGGPIVSASLASKTGGQPQLTANLQAAIYAEVSRGGGRILARPQIQAQSGTSASILTGDALPIVTAITFAGSSPVVQQQVQYVNVGVNLQIQPRITTDGFVTSHIFSEVSSVTGYIQGYPQISQRVATTSATVRDGDSYVIGGLIQENELTSLSKIPALGDLPLIGSLFRVRHDTRQRTNLYIVVTPRVVGTITTAGK